MIKLALATGLTLGVLCATALAGTQIIKQKGRAFSADELTIKKGDTVTFFNDDNVPHNVMSSSKDNGFDLGSQRPGTSTDVTFTTAGETVVICAIHPRMRVVINIVN